MQLWWRIRGWTRLRLTSADCAARLREISREIRMEDIRFINDLTVEFTVLRSEQKKIQVRSGETLEVVSAGGLSTVLRQIWNWRLLASVVLLLGMLTVYLPTRVWFIRVEGNGGMPARRILEEAEGCGVYFGASIRALRSEQVKNHLLYAIPQLRWAGVNTQGCTAIITVSVRDAEEMEPETVPGDIVAGVDALVTEVYPESGSAQVTQGQAVREGQILISGMTDLGLLTRADRAEGEVYGLTRREVTAVLPERTLQRVENGGVIRRYALLIGKKCVNFSNDSGILHESCVKMRTVNYLTLPGGFQLPAALVTETYVLCETEEIPRETDEQLTDAARRFVKERMNAGTILGEQLAQEGNQLTAVFECREMIGVFRPGVYLERDTNDRENGERGAG